MKYRGKEMPEDFCREVSERAGTIFSDHDETDVERILEFAEIVYHENEGIQEDES